MLLVDLYARYYNVAHVKYIVTYPFFDGCFKIISFGKQKQKLSFPVKLYRNKNICSHLQHISKRISTHKYSMSPFLLPD